MKNLSLTRTHFSMAAGTVLLAACGGGGGSAPAPAPAPAPVVTTEVPASASASSAGALAFVKGVAATSSDTAEPLLVGDATLATSDTEDADTSI